MGETVQRTGAKERGGHSGGGGWGYSGTGLKRDPGAYRGTKRLSDTRIITLHLLGSGSPV